MDKTLANLGEREKKKRQREGDRDREIHTQRTQVTNIRNENAHHYSPHGNF